MSISRFVPGLVALAALLATAPLEAAPVPLPVPLSPAPLTPVVLPVPLPPAPFTPAGASLAEAYRAIQIGSRSNPIGARNARFAYAAALARLRAGDFASARAEAARALSLAGLPQRDVLVPAIQVAPVAAGPVPPPLPAGPAPRP